MKIDAVEWVKENPEKLTEEETAQLNEHDFFDQMEAGELSMSLPDLMTVINILGEAYNRDINNNAVGGKL